MSYILKRKESEEIEKENIWLMVYGRRKTGKTFMLRNLCKFDNYLLIKKDLKVLFGSETKTIGELVKETRNLLAEGKSVVIDEFQRLDEPVLEELVQEHPKGRLIVCGSSMRIAKKFFDSKSPLLGFFTPMKIRLIRPSDILAGLSTLSCEKRIEISTFLREPWLIPLFNNESIEEFVYKIVTKSRHIISSLIGEIFSEEERELSRRYEVILSLVGAGIWSTKDLTNILYSRNLIPDPSPTHILQYLKNLEEMELIESIKLYKSKNRNFYRLCSPIMSIYYYLDDRYDIRNRDVSIGEIKPTLNKLIDFEIQNFSADFFAEKLQGRKEYFITPEKEIDFIITKRNKPDMVGEVKWKNAGINDIKQFKKASEDFSCRKVLVCKKGTETNEIELIDAEKLCRM